MSKSVFISHSVRDKEVVEHLVELIEEGIGIPENEIFCSSLDGYGIPTGDNFISFIKSQMQEPKVVILLLTPCYFNSNFCLSELGAAWVKSHKVFPILVPPLNYDAIKDVLTGTQAINICDDVKYNELRDHLVDAIGFEPKSSTKWDTKRKSFLKKINASLEDLEVPEKVSKEEHETVCKLLEEAKSELDEYEAELSELKKYIKKLEKAKDKAEVEEVKAKHHSTGISDEFENILSEIAAYKDILGDKEVLKFILSDYYGKPYRIEHFQYGAEFSYAARCNFVTLEDEERVNWDNKRIQKLKEYLDNLSFLIEEDDRGCELTSYYDSEYEVPMEPDNQEFWEYHYEI